MSLIRTWGLGVQAFLIVSEDVVVLYMEKLDQVGVQAFVSAGV